MATPLITVQPFKTLYMLVSLVFIGVRVPFWTLYFIPSFLRQHPGWSYRQALMVRIVRSFLLMVASVEQGTKIPLSGDASQGWVVIQPARSDAYTGVMTLDKQTRPDVIGGTWYPKTLEKYDGGEIVLHIHGGGFVVGDGRYKGSGFTAKLILKNTQAAHAFFPQYRLSSRRGNRFPAALQDVITSYCYLTETLKIPARNITISGDSAGGNLALSFLRYVADSPKAGLQSPSCAWLWSLWANPGRSLVTDPPFFATNSGTEYLNDPLGFWCASTYEPHVETGITLAHPNICFTGTPFVSKTPMFFAVGECEALYFDIIKVYEGLKAMRENKIGLYIQRKATHDIVLFGGILGFETEATKSVEAANKFWDGCK
ncbi:Alpha/Beta hydrolase protein [Xylogone sp. PMI_703]|nr:Alpha/Beta hydrolase protein [Xylogone sp. PMI_703]